MSTPIKSIRSKAPEQFGMSRNALNSKNLRGVDLDRDNHGIGTEVGMSSTKKNRNMIEYDDPSNQLL